MPTSSRPRITYSTALVIAAVSRRYRYGFDISDVTGLPSGTVYPVLRRLEDAGLLRSRWEAVSHARAEQRPPRRYYTLTDSGAEVAQDAVQRYPGLLAALDRPGAAPRPSPA